MVGPLCIPGSSTLSGFCGFSESFGLSSGSAGTAFFGASDGSGGSGFDGISGWTLGRARRGGSDKSGRGSVDLAWGLSGLTGACCAVAPVGSAGSERCGGPDSSGFAGFTGTEGFSFGLAGLRGAWTPSALDGFVGSGFVGASDDTLGRARRGGSDKSGRGSVDLAWGLSGLTGACCAVAPVGSAGSERCGGPDSSGFAGFTGAADGSAGSGC